jgi:uroporphyrinogen decarboxylase
MTGLERIMRTFNFEKVSPPPRMLHNFMIAAEYAGYSMKEYREDPKKIARAHIDFAREFHMDGILLDIDTCLEADAIGVEVDYPENEPARIITSTMGGLDDCIEAMDKNKLLQNKRIMIALEAMRLMRAEVGGEILLRGNADQGPFSLAMLSMGITPFMMSLYDEPEKTLELINKAYDVHIEFHRLMKEAGADITSFGDSSCGPDLISPPMYREFAYPFHKRMANDLKTEGIKTICHICGNLDLILEDLVSVGFPAIEIDYKTNIARAAELMKNKAVMFGPLNPSGVFYFGDEELISKETKKILSLFDGVGLVIGAGCALPTGIPRNNIKAFINALA